MKRLLILVVAVLVLSACDDSNITGFDSDDSAVLEIGSKTTASAVKVKVMTRNLYVGADVDRIIEEQDALQIPLRVAEAWATLQATDWPVRAQAIASEIADERPHLVGLQEVSLIRTQEPADFQLNAQDVAYDFLATLEAELASLGAEYYVAGIVENIDIEVPRLTEQGGFADVRLTDYEAVLARADVPVENVQTATYAASFPVQGFQIRRGYVALDATIEGKVFRFVSTHLEPASTFDGYFQNLQAQELIATLAPEQRPTILVGDLNTPAPVSPVYQQFLEAGFEDVWPVIGDKHVDAETCCHASDLMNPIALFDERIDLVLVRNIDELQASSGELLGSAYMVGREPDEKTPTGIWPSDHAGVVAQLQFPNPGQRGD